MLARPSDKGQAPPGIQYNSPSSSLAGFTVARSVTWRARAARVALTPSTSSPSLAKALPLTANLLLFLLLLEEEVEAFAEDEVDALLALFAFAEDEVVEVRFAIVGVVA